MKNNIFKLADMTEAFAADICTWKYGGEYEIYSFDGDEEDYEQLLSGLYLAVLFLGSNELAGFICVGPAAQQMCEASEPIYADESYTDMALGLRPSLCGLGRGYGEALAALCIDFLRGEFPGDGLRLTVAANNIRAKTVYQKSGFSPVFNFSKVINGNDISFEIMQLD